MYSLYHIYSEELHWVIEISSFCYSFIHKSKRFDTCRSMMWLYMETTVYPCYTQEHLSYVLELNELKLYLYSAFIWQTLEDLTSPVPVQEKLFSNKILFRSEDIHSLCISSFLAGWKRERMEIASISDFCSDYTMCCLLCI